MNTSVMNTVSEWPQLKLNPFKQSTQKEEWKRFNREEEGDGGTQGHRDIETWVVTKYNGGQAEVPLLFTGFFLNKLYQGNADEVHYVT
jgi:hypothetical protein